jgi:hypothetical protein
MAVDKGMSSAEVCRKLVVSLVFLWDPGQADRSRKDEKKLRADSPAMPDYLCIFKSCKRFWGVKADGG